MFIKNVLIPTREVFRLIYSVYAYFVQMNTNLSSDGFAHQNRRALIISLFGLCLLSSVTYSKPPENWASAAYAYKAKNTDLRTILENFSSSFGINLVMSEKLAGTSNGWIRANSASEFLDRLAVKYKFQWFVYSNELYVSPITDNVIKRIEISQEGSLDLKRAIKGVGLFEEKFGWGDVTDEGAVLISGPREYVKLVQSLIKTKQKKVEERAEIMVFSLRHANVGDREITIREQRTVIPGVASVLRNLLEKNRNATSQSFTTMPGQAASSNSSAVNTLQAMTASAEARLKQSPWKHDQAGQASSTSRSKGVRVEADIRTNSVLIHDDTSNRAYYQALIESLDIPKNLIEIEAIIVDIDRNRLKELGVDWQYLNNGKGIASNVSGFGQNPIDQFSKGSATILISDIGRFYASLRLLENEGEASVIANPSVLTLENQPAVIDLSETTYIETVGERVANVLPVTAGTMLRVTPRKIDHKFEHRIQLIVDIEDGRIEQTDAGSLPRIKRNTISTKAVIDKDYSLVVGGYHLQESAKNVSKIPLLGDIPFIGKLFTSENDKISHRERLFILTPHISGYRHQAQSYSDLDETGMISSALQRSSERQKKSSQTLVDEVSSLFLSLAKEHLPKGYKIVDAKSANSCQSNSAYFDFSKGREIAGNGLTVSVGTVQNTGKQLIDINESACHQSGVIGISFWPSSTLALNEVAEVFIAREVANLNQNARALPSLLKGI